LPGGYQYISRGLLLQLQSEGEVASIVSRGVAHTALRSITRERTRIQYANIGGIPLEDPDRLMSLSTADDSYIPFGFLTFRRGYEFEADYFGVQYLYKAGYDPACFIQAVQSIWPQRSGTKSNALSPFPPLKDRIKYLQKEISEILPARDQAIISRPDFIEFQKHLRDLPPAKSDQPVFKVPPTLMWSQPISPYSSLSK
jgi:predicted Zn-dependent protease